MRDTSYHAAAPRHGRSVHKRSRPEAQTEAEKRERWVVAWLDSVATGRSTMSRRTLTSLATRGGGVAAVRKLAKARGVHLVVLTDDRGIELVAASMHRFKILT